MNKSVEKIVLEKVERLTRKNANANQDLPKCPILIHSPKRPKR